MGCGRIVVLLLLSGVPAQTRLRAQELAPSRHEQPQGKKAHPVPVTAVDALGDPLPEGAIARVGTNRLRSDVYVNVIAFSADGRLLAYGSEHGRVYVANGVDGKSQFELRLVKDRIQPVTEMAFSPDGKTLAASGYWSPAIWLIDVATHKIKQTIPNTVEGQDRWSRAYQGPCMAFTPDGRTLVVGGKDGALYFWDPATGKRLARLAENPKVVLNLAMTPDGKTALTAHHGGELHLWSIVTRKHLGRLPMATAYPQLTALSPDGKAVALSASEVDIEIRDLAGKLLYKVRATAPIGGIAFTPDGTMLRAADWHGNVLSWDVNTGKSHPVLNCEGIRVSWEKDQRRGPKPTAWFRADGKMVAWSTGSVIRLWDLATGKERPQLNKFQAGIAWAGFSADGQFLRTGGQRGELITWELSTGRAAHEGKLVFPPGFRPSLRYSASAERDRIVVAVRDDQKPVAGQIRIWDPASGRVLPLPQQVTNAWNAHMTPDSRQLVTSEEGRRFGVYDCATWKPTRRIQAATDLEHDPAISADSALLATTAGDAMVRVYDFRTGRLLHSFEGPSPASCVAFSPDDRRLASGHMKLLERVFGRPGADSIQIWDLAAAREHVSIPTGHNYIRALAYSPDGRLLASCGSDGDVRVWETASGHERRRYVGHRRWVNSVDFSRDGSRLASAGSDGMAVVWRVLDIPHTVSSDADFESLWADLARDGVTAHRAIGRLVAYAKTPEYLEKRLKPARGPEPKRLDKLIVDLASSRFSDRERARQELEDLGDLAEPALRSFGSTKIPLETRRRAEALLKRLQGPVSEPPRLQQLRAIETLERIALPQARELLAALSKGAPGALLTNEAQQALRRLAKKH